MKLHKRLPEAVQNQVKSSEISISIELAFFLSQCVEVNKLPSHPKYKSALNLVCDHKSNYLTDITWTSGTAPCFMASYVRKSCKTNLEFAKRQRK